MTLWAPAIPKLNMFLDKANSPKFYEDSSGLVVHR